MERKQRTWEKLYLKYVNGEMEAKYEELNKKYGKDRTERRKEAKNGKDTLSAEQKKLYDALSPEQKKEYMASLAEQKKKKNEEEHSEYEKMTKVKKNLVQVKNVVEYLNRLYKYQERIEEEIDLRENGDVQLGKLDEELKKINEGLRNAESTIKSLQKKLNGLKKSDPDYTNVQKQIEEKEKEKTKLLGQREENGKKYNAMYNDKMKEDSAKNKVGEFSKLTPEQLRELHKAICMKISESHYFGKKLMNGESINDLKWNEKDFKYKKYVAKDREKDKIEQLKDAAKSDLPVKEETISEATREEEEIEGEQLESTSEFDQKHPMLAKIKNFFKADKEVKESGDKSLAVVSEFDQKHPRLAKIKNFFKSLNEKRVEEENFEQELIPEEKVSVRDKFLKQLDVREVAQKGMETVQEEAFQKKAEDYIKKRQEAGILSEKTAAGIKKRLDSQENDER